MLTLLALACAATPASTGCFNGGAFVGAQAGFTHVMLKKEEKDKATTKDQADALFNVISTATTYTAFDAADDADKGLIAAFPNKEFDEKSGLATLQFSGNVDFAAMIAKLRAFKGLKSIQVNIVTDAKEKLLAEDAAKKNVTDTLGKKEDFSKKLVADDGEQKYTSNNGFAGLHAGYLGRVNDKFLVGGLVEGNWVLGQGLKVNDKEDKETKARFNVGAYLRAMFNLTEKFMAGADLGFSGQEIRQEKVVGQKDKESKWFWNPAARLVLGVTLTDNILATAHFGGVFPMMKQDSLRDSSVKAKYSNFHGGVGISYVFGG